ncbi:MAG: SDR family NAD(P)-dependent oxidoreductase [Myxococcota bacterium]
MNIHSQSGARLQDLVVILTGAAGNIGSHISRYLLREGARVVMTGRNRSKLDTFVQALVEEGFDAERILVSSGDAADPEVCRRTVAETLERFSKLDVLVNNAGGAGPKRTLENIPFAADRDGGETMFDASSNLLGGPWNMTRAAVPSMSVGGSIINISTIFSRTAYFGRIPYVVPKSGLNALSQGLARELGRGESALRVNTIFPGPIESERIDTVFAAMDELQGLDAGSTSTRYRELMINQRPDGNGELAIRYPKPQDVAATVTWLASPESAAFSGHRFEVTNGMQVPAQSRSKLVSWPDNRLVDLRDRCILILAGGDLDESLVFAARHESRGARVVLASRTLEDLGRLRAKRSTNGAAFRVQHLDPLRAESIDRTLDFLQEQFGRLDGVVVLPATPNGGHGYSLSTAGDDDVEHFIRTEVVAPVAFASRLARRLRGWKSLRRAPAVTFVTNPDDGRGNRLNEIKRAAVEELIRVWRDEEAHAVENGERRFQCLPNQIVRFDNHESDNLAFSADWAATLANRVRKMDPINLWVPKRIQRATGKSSMPMAIQRVLPGLHAGKTAVITGGSLGIGLQLGRFLAMAGAKVLLSARSRPRLESAREEIVQELSRIGYAEPEERVHILDDIDVGDEDALVRLHEHATELFGTIDFLVNNAGISGAEEMAVDMTVEAWNRTMEANLISNYSLIRKFAPGMKRAGGGRILNVSSYFGGEKYLAVAYPNRSDYSVSKAGQRALAEILSRHLGPEIQINALAPGPVDGARLRGLGGAPGLFARRGRLILENKRLNQVHKAVLRATGDGAEIAELLPRLADNAIDALNAWAEAPKSLKKLFAQVAEGAPGAPSATHLLSDALAPKLTQRLVAGGQVSPRAAEQYLAGFKSPDEPFFHEDDVRRAAEKIEAGIIDRLHLHQMPTDEQVGLSTVFSLADEIVSGETFHPSGGLKFERSVTEGELMLPPGAESLENLRGKNVVLYGDAMRDELVAMARGFFDHGVSRLTILTRGAEAADALRARLDAPAGVSFAAQAVADDLEGGLAGILRDHGRVDVVVSTPFSRLPMKGLAADANESWERVLSHVDFSGLIRDQLTHHFRIAKVAALIPRSQIVLVTPDTSRASTREEFALALFVKNSLHAFTVTLGVEGERLPTEPAINQVQLTRRARSEEPGTDQELLEETDRMVAAVLQCAVSAPSPGESRYLARIFRGNAVTV